MLSIETNEGMFAWGAMSSSIISSVSSFSTVVKKFLGFGLRNDPDCCLLIFGRNWEVKVLAFIEVVLDEDPRSSGMLGKERNISENSLNY